MLTNVTKANIPSKSVLDNTPLAYKDQAINATLSGYHAAFIVAIIFGILGFIIAFLLKKKEPVLMKAGIMHDYWSFDCQLACFCFNERVR